MVIYIGADHRGFDLKKYLKGVLMQMGYTVVDVGNEVFDENDDYPDFARMVGGKVSLDYENSRGILLCSSGVGVSVVANKFPNVRAACAASPDQAFDSRNDDNANVLCLAVNYLEPDEAKKIVTTWIQTPFSGEERHKRRLQKISDIETEVASREEVKPRFGQVNPWKPENQ